MGYLMMVWFFSCVCRVASIFNSRPHSLPDADRLHGSGRQGRLAMYLIRQLKMMVALTALAVAALGALLVGLCLYLTVRTRHLARICETVTKFDLLLKPPMEVSLALCLGGMNSSNLYCYAI